MSMDKSLVMRGKLKRQRNVLTRAERVAKLIAEERWEEGRSVFALPKLRVVVTKRKAKAAAAAAAPAAATAEGAPAAQAPAPASASGKEPAKK
ncbi:MAG: small basic protein [Planctomycetota bacterium]